jgi:agmatine deiminase
MSKIDPTPSPVQLPGLIVPGEWEPHRALWTCWPSDRDLWEEYLVPARGEVGAMVRALAAMVDPGPGRDLVAGDRVIVLAADGEAAADARACLPDTVAVHEVAFGDIWLRDTGPIFARTSEGPVALRFVFNGWGGKYALPGDDTVGQAVADLAGVPARAAPFVLEGGAVDHDGAGTVLTTRQCLLNPNRNPAWDEAAAEAALAAALGARKVLWLGDGLLNDHTDGHVDNIARFVAPGRVMCMSPFGDDDPNAAVLAAIEADLRAMTDADCRPLEVATIPSPGLVLDEDGEAIPASHMNFIIGNATVVMPHYGTPSADAALQGLARAFPDRRVVGVRSTAVLTGGGSFHCITQQQPV